MDNSAPAACQRILCEHDKQIPNWALSLWLFESFFWRRLATRTWPLPPDHLRVRPRSREHKADLELLAAADPPAASGDCQLAIELELHGIAEEIAAEPGGRTTRRAPRAPPPARSEGLQRRRDRLPLIGHGERPGHGRRRAGGRRGARCRVAIRVSSRPLYVTPVTARRGAARRIRSGAAFCGWRRPAACGPSRGRLGAGGR